MGTELKVQLIGTVLHEPDLLILDEPFAGLDPAQPDLFNELLLEYRERYRSVLSTPRHGARRGMDHIRPDLQRARGADRPPRRGSSGQPEVRPTSA